MRFEVPQFIEIEDKIFGPLTWRQFIYLGGGVGLGVVMFITFGFLIGVFVGIPLALLGGALSFFPVNSRPFDYFLQAIISYTRGKKLYLWRREQDVVYKQRSETTDTTETPIKLEPNPSISPKISLARRLELEIIQKPD